ncbi:hypothetical protein N0V83_008288 [Neocucurbitaria cava]|uniref:Uncharacterized protein n=1 Tax=Neocucurbitaria cava TaxID=798079 RepID=A0A9W8Y2R0_9PLEO|nr:hypothetical protein N0V83_008288 [Neocucurbitaria cava]
MAVKIDSLPHKAEEAEVASCVSNLVQAFTNGLNIFKRLRERRRKRKARKENQAPDPSTSAELQLSKSLRKGPQDLAEKYAECYHSGMGPRFAKGDAIAHASLAETLIKLNTGLVGIIATFLNHDHSRGKGHLDLDYKSLTNLSDASRKEALQSMTQLYQRLSSHSQLQLYNIGVSPCARCGSANHADCSGRSTSPTEKEQRKRHTSSSRQRSNGAVVTKMPIKSSNQPQLVVMRPKNARKGSSSSSNSSSSTTKSPSSSNNSSGYSTPSLPSPLPKYVPVEPLEFQALGGVIHGTMGGYWPPAESAPSTPKPRKDSFHDPTWRQQYVYTPIITTTPDQLLDHLHHPIPKLPSFTPTPPRRQSPPRSQQQSQSLPQHPKRSPPAPPSPLRVPSSPSSYSPSSPPLLKRRIDKATPSSYTFASDSTKLGEIPQRNWTQPWDYEQAERLNAEAAVIGHPSSGTAAAAAAAVGGGKKKGMFRFLRRGSAGGA